MPLEKTTNFLKGEITSHFALPPELRPLRQLIRLG